MTDTPENTTETGTHMPEPTTKAKPQPTQGGTINYLVIALTFAVLGAALGIFVYRDFAPQPTVETASLDNAAVEAIVEDVLLQRGLIKDMQVMADDDPFVGPQDAPIVIVEFSAYACPYCGRHFEETFTPLLENYGEHIRYVFRDFPSINQAVSFPASLAANCAYEQDKFWDYHALLYENQSSLGENFFYSAAEMVELDMDEFETCYTDQRYSDEVSVDFQAGIDNDVSGTPSFYINGQFHSGARPYAYFERIIQQELDALGIAY